MYVKSVVYIMSQRKVELQVTLKQTLSCVCAQYHITSGRKEPPRNSLMPWASSVLLILFVLLSGTCHKHTASVGYIGGRKKRLQSILAESLFCECIYSSTYICSLNIKIVFLWSFEGGVATNLSPWTHVPPRAKPGDALLSSSSQTVHKGPFRIPLLPDGSQFCTFCWWLHCLKWTTRL